MMTMDHDNHCDDHHYVGVDLMTIMMITETIMMISGRRDDNYHYEDCNQDHCGDDYRPLCGLSPIYLIRHVAYHG